jgi:hypothetical protein
MRTSRPAGTCELWLPHTNIQTSVKSIRLRAKRLTNPLSALKLRPICFKLRQTHTSIETDLFYAEQAVVKNELKWGSKEKTQH